MIHYPTLCTFFLSLALEARQSTQLVERFKMPDGGWDYATSDSDKNLIYWSRTGFTDVTTKIWIRGCL